MIIVYNMIINRTFIDKEYIHTPKGSRKKNVLLLMAGPLRGERGERAGPLRKK